MTVVPKLVFASILVTILTETHCKHIYEDVSPALEKQLSREERKAACCAKKMRCCKNHPPPPNVEIRAVIARCIDAPSVCTKNRNLKKPLNKANVNNLEKFQGFDEDEPLIQSEVTKCSKKLILTIKMKNEGETNTKNQFIVIDHVYDPVSDKTVRLLNPYVIKMKQEHLSQAYGLKFVDFVNSQAREQVYNKHDGNYTGCCMNEKKPTCGLVTYRGKTVPYSGGFCCSCDAEKNALRQPQSGQTAAIAYSDPAYLYDAVQCPRTSLKDENIKKKYKDKMKTRKVKRPKKRHLEGSNMYYIDPKMKHKLRKSKDINNFDIENNYKIQSMNDEYEDQLTDNGNVPIQLGENTNFNKEHHEKDKPVKKHSSGTNGKMFKNENKEHYTENEKSGNKDMKTKAIVNQKSTKPSMHKILHFDNAYSISKVYDMNNIKNIADQAFNNAIKLQDQNTYMENSEKNVDSFDKRARIDWLDIPHSKRQVQSSGVQKRGGQNCADRYTPPNADPETYHESTHCLRFSPIWYGVYRLQKPVVEQETIFQIFEKYDIEGGGVKWKDLTNGQKIRLGTFSPYYKDEIPTISMKFNSVMDDHSFCLDWDRLRLLIPEGVDINELSKYPESKGGPTEYLMVPSDKIILTGDQCNVAGVGFEAFFNQPNRCSMPRGSCLHHQPYNLWHYDKTLERSGKRGCYFLKHHGKISKNPIRRNTSSGEKFLTLNYYGHYVSMIDMEINADFNAVLRPITAAVITEVYIDSTCRERTTVTIKVSNAGLLSSQFMVRICDCPLDIQGELSNIQTDLVIIPPQQQHIFTLNFHAILNSDIFHCSVEALNANGELVALRRIKIQKLDRCICTWHCLCACIGSATGLKCIPMKLDHYHAAGFKGGLPIVTHVSHETLTNDVYRLIIFIISFVFFTLFILGLTKAILGLCCLPIGMWGLNVLLDLPKPMNKYYERSLRDRPVVYDQNGWPVHPDTREKVRNIPKTAEFCTNVLFFYSYPTVICILVVKRICCPYYAYEKVQKPKSKKDKWLERRKCSVKTCFTKGMQTDGDTDTDTNIPQKLRRSLSKKSSKSLTSADSQRTSQETDQQAGPHTRRHRGRQPGHQTGQQEGLQTGPQTGQQRGRRTGLQKRQRPGQLSGLQIGHLAGSHTGRRARQPKGHKPGQKTSQQEGLEIDPKTGLPILHQTGQQAGLQPSQQSSQQIGEPAGSQGTQSKGSSATESEGTPSKKKKKKRRCASRSKSSSSGKSKRSWLRFFRRRRRSKTPKTKKKKSKSKKGKSSSESVPQTPVQNPNPTEPNPPQLQQIKSNAKKKPSIKISIKERLKERCLAPPRRQSSVEISDNPYYYSSDNTSAFSDSIASTPRRGYTPRKSRSPHRGQSPRRVTGTTSNTST